MFVYRQVKNVLYACLVVAIKTGRYTHEKKAKNILEVKRLESDGHLKSRQLESHPPPPCDCEELNFLKPTEQVPGVLSPMVSKTTSSSCSSLEYDVRSPSRSPVISWMENNSIISPSSTTWNLTPQSHTSPDPALPSLDSPCLISRSLTSSIVTSSGLASPQGLTLSGLTSKDLILSNLTSPCMAAESQESQMLISPYLVSPCSMSPSLTSSPPPPLSNPSAGRLSEEEINRIIDHIFQIHRNQTPYTPEFYSHQEERHKEYLVGENITTNISTM